MLKVLWNVYMLSQKSFEWCFFTPAKLLKWSVSFSTPLCKECKDLWICIRMQTGNGPLKSHCHFYAKLLAMAWNYGTSDWLGSSNNKKCKKRLLLYSCRKLTSVLRATKLSCICHRYILNHVFFNTSQTSQRIPQCKNKRKLSWRRKLPNTHEIILLHFTWQEIIQSRNRLQNHSLGDYRKC